MKTYLNILIDKLEVLYENIYHLLIAFQKATNSESSKIEVPIKDPNTGAVTNVTIDSISDLKSEINRISNNFKAMTNNGDTQVLNADGTISTFKRVSFVNAEYIDMSDMSIGDKCIVDNRSILSDFVHPVVKIPIIIKDEKLHSNTIVARSFNVTEGYDSIPVNVSYTEFDRMIKSGVVVADQENVRELQTVREQVIYHGKFDVKSVEYSKSNDTYTVVLNDIKYTGINVIGSAIELQVGDELVKEDGSASYTIKSISIYNNTVVLKIKNGAGVLDTTQKLMYNQKLNTIDEHTIGFPVKPLQNLVVFFSTLNDNAISFPSKGMKISTRDYKVLHKGVEYSIDEFYSMYVTNITEFIKSITEQNSIPLSSGIIPTTPVLNASNFKVSQVNKHITNSSSVKDINTLNAEKARIQNQIDITNQNIKDLQSKINNGEYTTISSKNEMLSKIDEYRSTILVLEQQLLGVARKIDNEALDNKLGTIKSKFKIFGYWPINNPYSPMTGVQKIIRYDVQYRYLNINTEDVQTTSIKMVDGDKEITVSFSPWNVLQTETLQKVRSNDGKMVWDTQRVDATEDLGINQCMISINENESVEVRVRAVSEVGYPLSPIKSEWSNIVRINFPDYLKQTEINTTVEKNNLDLRLAEYINVLQSRGVISHISGQITEADKTFHHTANFITSGQFDNNMRNIPLDVCIADIIRDIKILRDNSSNPRPYISIVDHLGNSFEVGNHQQISFNVTKPNMKRSAGEIIREKFFIKIKNRNNVPINIQSLYGVNMDESDMKSIYREVPVKFGKSYNQVPGQVLYFRSVDMSLHDSMRLYHEHAFDVVVNLNTHHPYNNHDQFVHEMNGTPSNFDAIGFMPKDTSAGSNRKYIKIPVKVSAKTLSGKLVTARMYSKNTVPTISSNNIGDFSASVSDEKSLPEYWYSTEQIGDFLHIRSLTSTLVSEQQDRMYYDDTEKKYYLYFPDQLGFRNAVKDTIGLGTCGAFLYPIMNNNHIIRGDEAGSVYVLHPDEEISIPVMFEYRFTDALGNKNGLNVVNPSSRDGLYKNNSIEAQKLADYYNRTKYSKTLGISMIVDRSLFLFDMNVYVNFG